MNSVDRRQPTYLRQVKQAQKSIISTCCSKRLHLKVMGLQISISEYQRGLVLGKHTCKQQIQHKIFKSQQRKQKQFRLKVQKTSKLNSVLLRTNRMESLVTLDHNTFQIYKMLIFMVAHSLSKILQHSIYDSSNVILSTLKQSVRQRKK